MIEFAGLLYGLVRDLGSYLAWDEDEELVDIRWPEESGFKDDAEKEDYKIVWSRPDKIASKKLKGYDVLYEVNKIKRIRYRIVLRDGLTLVGKKDAEDAT